MHKLFLSFAFLLLFVTDVHAYKYDTYSGPLGAAILVIVIVIVGVIFYFIKRKSSVDLGDVNNETGKED